MIETTSPAATGTPIHERTDPMTTSDPYAASHDRLGGGVGYDVATLLMLLFGGFVVPVIGWMAAVVMAWNLPRWTTGQKWLATLIWPVALAAPVATLVLVDGFNTGAGAPLALAAVGFAVLAVPLATAYLGRAAARARHIGL